MKDGLLEKQFKLIPGIGGGSIFTNDEYRLTDEGKEFVGHLRGNEPVADIIAWAEDTFPDGRHIYYEGDEPGIFAATIKDEFGFDVTANPDCVYIVDDGEGDPFASYAFHCPVEFLGDIYYSHRWPMGS